MEGVKIIGDVLENVPNDALYKLTERQRFIYNILKSNVPNNVPKDVSDIKVETAESLAIKLSVSTKTIKRDLKYMKELGVIMREGGNFGDHWEIIKWTEKAVCLALATTEAVKDSEVRKTIMDYCKENIEDRAQPCGVVFVDDMPLTGFGKIDVKLLEQKYGTHDYTKD